MAFGNASVGGIGERKNGVFPHGTVRFATALPKNLTAAMKVTILEAPIDEQRHLTQVAMTLEHMVANVVAGNASTKNAKERII
jgi:hypothetical protein